MLAVAFLTLALAVQLPSAQAGVAVHDDAGQQVTVGRPAQRIVTLAPHLTEMMFAIGAGNRIVGTVEFSDFPEEARHIPRIGDSYRLDMERILALKPDLVLAWKSGNSQKHLEPLRRQGVPVFVSEPRTLESVPQTMVRLGVLTGSQPGAQGAADRFRHRIETLRLRYAGRRTLDVFYQIADRPLYTLSDQSLAGKLLQLCSGRNIFGHLAPLAPTISTEAVVAADPDVILASQPADRLLDWNRHSGMKAVRNDAVYTLDPDLLSRPGPRLADGAEAVCARLDEARSRQAAGDSLTRAILQ